MSARGWSTDPQSRSWPGLVDSLPAGGELHLGRLARSSSHPRRARSGWHAYRPSLAVALPPWAVEVTLTIEHPAGTSSNHQSAGPQALMLLRSANAVESIMLTITDAMAEIERIAGVRRAEPDLHLVRSIPEPNLEPLAPSTVLRHLRRASQRGLAARSRRRSSASVAATWESRAGAVVTCWGPAGLSAQAVISLHGLGNARWLRLPPGGAIVMRAWRPERTGRADLIPQALAVAQPGTVRHQSATWALASGLVLASSSASGLGRMAGRLAVSIRAGGWDATVLTGPAALDVVRAGDPRQPVPRIAARWITDDELAAMLAACLAAGMPT